MTETVLDHFRVAEPHLDPRLIAPAVVADMRRIARLFPPVMGLDLECRLGIEAPQADFLLRVLRTDACRAALLDRGEPRLSDVVRAHPIWQNIVTLARAWDDENGLLESSLDDLFLEFDMVERTQHEIPIPCCFLDFKGEADKRFAQLDRAMPILHGASRWAAVRSEVERCMSLLPKGAYVPSMGWMLPRGMEGVRFCAAGTDMDGWLAYLERVGWPGSRRGLEAATRDLAGLVDRIELDLDVGPGVGPKMGFELQIDAGIWKGKERWTKVLDWLVEHESCLPAKRDAVLSWIGYTHARSAPEVWPQYLLARSRELGDKALSVFTRRIGHMKMTYVEGRPLEAKVYLEFMHYWLHYSQNKRRYVMDERDPDAWSE